MVASKGLALLSFLLLPFSIVTASDSVSTTCYPPDDAAARVLVGTIETAAAAAEKTVKTSGMPADTAEELQETLKHLTKSLTKRTPFGKCWYTSRFDCFKVQGALGDVNDHLKVDGEHLQRVRQSEGATAGKNNYRAVLEAVTDFCDELRS